jgi:hypothetical protein
MNTDPNLNPIEEADAKKRTLILAMSGVVVLSICVLFTLAFLWFQPDQNGLLAKYFPSPTATRRPANTPAPTKTLIPNLTATQSAWLKPEQSPALGSAEDAQSALESGMNYLEGFAFVVPDTPEINQPGDVYIYEIQLDQSESVLWSYGWCTTSETILDENFTHMQVEFIVNEVSAAPDHFLIQDEIGDDGSACREYTTTLNSWPSGQHQLEVRVTFTSPTDDGWNLYPAGTHTFKYMVNVN